MGVMAGKVCIVTGGAGSIGLASARLFLQEGARVMLVGRNEANGSFPCIRSEQFLDRERLYG